jgi:ABC-type transport system involved in multi-copper enzyme maturation permease subunit
MKTLAIALKDLSRSFRSFFALAFMFGVPVLTTLLFAFLFGGQASGEGSEFTIPNTKVRLANQDEGSSLVPAFNISGVTYDNLGAVLADILQNDDFSDLMTIEISEAQSARAAVDNKQAGLAIIIPSNFTEAATGLSESQAEVIFYQDPEQNLGPQVVQSIVMSITDGFSSTSLSLKAINSALETKNLSLSQTEQIALSLDLSKNTQSLMEPGADLSVISPIQPGDEQEANLLGMILRAVMAGMMIFYAFFTGTSAAQLILQEEEDGTLQRLFITPTDTRTILNGKFLSGFLTVIVQVTVLLIFANLVFGINWGPFVYLIPFTIGAVTISATFGIFIMSLVKNTKQAGIIYGGVLTFTGMLGISGVFTMGTPAAEAFKIIPLMVPQGWAMKSIEAAWSGNPQNSLLYAGGMFVWAVVFFFIGNARFTRRFA